MQHENYSWMKSLASTFILKDNCTTIYFIKQNGNNLSEDLSEEMKKSGKGREPWSQPQSLNSEAEYTTNMTLGHLFSKVVMLNANVTD